MDAVPTLHHKISRDSVGTIQQCTGTSEHWRIGDEVPSFLKADS
jgi:hypothetical protein